MKVAKYTSNENGNSIEFNVNNEELHIFILEDGSPDAYLSLNKIDCIELIKDLKYLLTKFE